MHASVLQFIDYAVRKYGLAHKNVLEVGSRDINGTPRPYFHGGVYWGVDMIAGPGVDEVCNAHDLLEHNGPADVAAYDVVVCTEMLEHDSAPWISVREMWRACRSAGMLLLTARGYDERGCFPVHGYPEDHWRYSVTGMRCLLEWSGWKPIEVKPDPQDPGVFVIAGRVS